MRLKGPVLSIIASPTLSSDVRHKATSLLRQLHQAYSTDKSKAKSKTPTFSSVESSGASGSEPTLVVENTTVPPVGAEPHATLVSLSEAEAKELEQAIEDGKADDQVENRPICTGEVLRVHGIYMKERREFDIRVGDQGKLELWDVKTGEKWK